MNDKKKVILINGNNSKWYEQVIFIVKDQKTNNIPKNLVLEAEKIINEYMDKKYNTNCIQAVKNNTENKNKNKIKFYNNLLNISIFLTIIFICFLLYQIYI